MTRVRWAPQAVEDLQSIRSYIARDSIEYADLIVDQIVEAVERVETHPRSGRMVPELGLSSIREVIVRSYRIVYLLEGDDAFILTVFHGARPFP
ncbi:MAG: type II toxin-antitoxin system RelE/ParE family toxin [Myxococcales bacterium]